MRFTLVNTPGGKRMACNVLRHSVGEDAETVFDVLLEAVGDRRTIDVAEDGTFWCDGRQVRPVEKKPVPVEPPPVPVKLPPEREPEPVVKRKPERREAPAPVSKKKGKKR